MPTHYIFVDFENIQPEADDLSFLNDERIQIIIFVNAQQKLSVDRVKILQPFGERVEYIEMSGSGKNALDFMISFYLGFIWRENAEAKFYIVSKDMGFDPLLKHLAATRSGSVKRLSAGGSIKKYMAALKVSPDHPDQPEIVRRRVTSICAALQPLLPENSLPDSVTAFEIFIKAALIDDDLPERHMAGLINFMSRKELISTDQDGGLKYQLENIAAGATGQFLSKNPANGAPPKPVPISATEELAKKACDDLKKRGNSKPRTLKTLASTIKAIFKGTISDQQVDTILNFMKGKKIITVSNGTKVTYDLEKSYLFSREVKKISKNA